MKQNTIKSSLPPPSPHVMHIHTAKSSTIHNTSWRDNNILLWKENNSSGWDIPVEDIMMVDAKNEPTTNPTKGNKPIEDPTEVNTPTMDPSVYDKPIEDLTDGNPHTTSEFEHISAQQ